MKKWLIALLVIVAFSCKNESSEDLPAKTEAYEQLVQELTKQVQQNPDSAPVRMRLVNALDSLGKYPEAIAQVDSMILRDSVNNGLWFAKGQLHEANGDTAEAIKNYEQALNIYPSLEAQFALANLLAEQGDERALQICHSLNRMGPDREASAHCDFISGVYYARTRQFDKALSHFDQCIKNNYTYMVAYMEKGFLYYEMKKYNDALQVFEKAITVNNMYADAYYWKAKTYEAMNNKQEAITNYQRSLGLDKSLKEARAALDRLDG